jgi:ABC-type sugar transport system substrate-binding protein
MNRRTASLTCARAAVLGVAGALARAPSAQPRPPRIVFLNPGEPVERGTGPYWRMVAQYMRAAAHQLGMALEVQWADRDHLLMQRQAELLALRPEAPDYIVLVNAKLAALPMLKTLRSTPARLFLMHNDLTAEQRREIGNEREQVRNWIGTATTDGARAAYLLMQELYRRLGTREAHIVGISGDGTTPVSLERESGVERYVREAGRGRTLQVVHGDWSFADGEQKARVLLQRYPDLNVLWGANDSMALGALRAAAAAAGRQPVLIGGIGGWGDALNSIAEGGLTATAAGEYLIGAWTAVMLHDHYHGHDFADHGGVRQKLDHLYVVHAGNVARYQEAVFRPGDRLDFGAWSQKRRPRPGPYAFSQERLMKPAPAR